MPDELTRRPRWQSWLPEPFWWTLAALLCLSLLTMVPLAIVVILLGDLVGANVSSVTGTGATLIFVGCYLVAIPVTWWLFRQRKPH
jgi:hypothetical protein